MLKPHSCIVQANSINNFTLNHGYRLARAKVYSDLLNYLGGASSPMVQAILAIDIWNEGFVVDNEAPFSIQSGTLNVDGIGYDLSNVQSRQQMIDASSVHLVNTVRTAIRNVAPNVLVGLSVYTPREVGRNGFNGAMHSTTEHRQPLRPLVLWRFSDIDFIDVHVYSYPFNNFLVEALDSAELNQGTVWNKPIIMGEFGAYKTDYPGKVNYPNSPAGYSDVRSAAAALENHMATSCNYGITGWGLWTWNTIEQLPPFWVAVEPNSSIINGAVAPAGRAIVCPPVPAGLFRNVAGTVAYSNGATYCIFSSWEHYTSRTYRTNTDGIPIYPRLPALMPYDGVCAGG